MNKKHTLMALASAAAIMVIAGFTYGQFAGPAAIADTSSLAATSTLSVIPEQALPTAGQDGLTAGDASSQPSTKEKSMTAPAAAPRQRPSASAAELSADDSNQVYSSSGSTYTLRIGQSVNIDGATVTPTDIQEDSRCPIDADCLEPGSVTVNMKIEKGGTTTMQAVTLGLSTSVFGHIAELTNVTPARMTGQDIDPSAYALLFSVTNG